MPSMYNSVWLHVPFTGAAAVVGVDGSERIAGFARQVANANKLGRDVEGPVRIVSSRIEELQSLPDGIDKVSSQPGTLPSCMRAWSLAGLLGSMSSACE
jgi:hypothetical protein